MDDPDGPEQIVVVQGLPVFDGKVLNGWGEGVDLQAGDGSHTSVADEEVDGAKGFQHPVTGGVEVIAAGDVGVKRQCLGRPQCLTFFGSLFCLFQIDVQQSDPGTGSGQSCGNATANPAGGTGDNGYFVGKIV